MGSMNPRGIAVEFEGEVRHLLFTLNVIDEIQTEYDKTIHEVIQDLTEGDVYDGQLRRLVTILLNDEARRSAKKDEKIEKVTESDVGDMIGLDNYNDVLVSLLKAYGISLPEPEEDDDPNLKSAAKS